MGGALYCSVALSLRVTRPLGLFEDGYFSDGDIKNIQDLYLEISSKIDLTLILSICLMSYIIIILKKSGKSI